MRSTEAIISGSRLIRSTYFSLPSGLHCFSFNWIGKRRGWKRGRLDWNGKIRGRNIIGWVEWCLARQDGLGWAWCWAFIIKLMITFHYQLKACIFLCSLYLGVILLPTHPLHHSGHSQCLSATHIYSLYGSLDCICADLGEEAEVWRVRLKYL